MAIYTHVIAEDQPIIETYKLNLWKCKKYKTKPVLVLRSQTTIFCFILDREKIKEKIAVWLRETKPVQSSSPVQ